MSANNDNKSWPPFLIYSTWIAIHHYPRQRHPNIWRRKNHLLLFDLVQVVAFHLRRPQVRPRPIGGEWGRPMGGEFWRKVHPPQIHLAAAAAAASAAAAPRCCCCLFARACRQQQGPGGRKRLIFRGCFSNLQVHTTSLAQGLGLHASGLVKLTIVCMLSVSSTHLLLDLLFLVRRVLSSKEKYTFEFLNQCSRWILREFCLAFLLFLWKVTSLNGDRTPTE